MKKVFTVNEAIDSAGCWKTNKKSDLINLVESLRSKETDLIYFQDVLNSSLISLHDKRWWIRNSCQLTEKELQLWALESAKVVAPIYNKKYPNDNRISLCVNIIARYLKGLVSLDTLIKWRKIAASAAISNAAYAAYAASAASAAYAAISNDIYRTKLLNKWIKLFNSFENEN